MLSLNYKRKITELETQVAEQTLADHKDVVHVLSSQLNALYGLLLTKDGNNTDIFPAKDKRRAQSFLLLVHSINAFHFSLTSLDMLIDGRYSEASALVRSLIETVAYAEYYSLKPDVAFHVTQNAEYLPSRSSIFKFLKDNGNWPKGGPEKAFKRHNDAAHGSIEYVVQHWTETSGNPQITKIWIRKYNSSSFIKISQDMIIPMMGIQSIFRKTFVDENKIKGNEEWLHYWEIGNNIQIETLFPKIKLGKQEN